MQFLTSKDETIKDVIKKLPGIDVDDLGVISYNGKNIRNFYVEGMDLTSGRYNQITDNLDAKAVESIQLLENHPCRQAINTQYTSLQSHTSRINNRGRELLIAAKYKF
jgi:hypothetical protein